MGRAARHARRLGAALGAALALGASAVKAEEPRVTCTATRSGRRVLVRPEALAFVSAELDRLIRLGLAGRLEVTLTLVRRRLWFDAREAEARLVQVLAFSREGGYALDGRELPEGPGALELERVAWTLEEAAAPGAAHEVRVEVRLQVVTASSLGQVAEWLTRGESTKGDEDERSALTQNLLRTVAEDLTRRASGRCEVGPPPGEDAG